LQVLETRALSDLYEFEGEEGKVNESPAFPASDRKQAKVESIKQ